MNGEHRLDRERTQLLQSLSQRIEGYMRDGEVRLVATDAAEREAEALIASVQNSPFDAEVQMTVAHLYWSRFEVGRASHATGFQTDGQTAVAHFSAVFDDYRQYVPAEAEEVLDHIGSMKERASDLLDRAGLPGGHAALDEAIGIIHEVVSMLGKEDPTLPIPLSELAVALEHRFLLTQRAEDIDSAVEIIERARALTHPDDEERRRRQQLYKWILSTRYDYRGDLADLERAIRLGYDFLDHAAPDDPDVVNVKLDFVSLYLRLYKVTQAIADLDTGIRFGREGLKFLIDPSQSDLRASRLDDLAVLLRYRGKRTGHTIDLDDAVTLSRQAAANFPTEHIDSIGIVSGLAESLRIAGVAKRDQRLLEEAVAVAEDVVRRAVERAHPALPGFRQNVGISYEALAGVDPVVLHLRRAVEFLREAVAGFNDGPHRRGACSDLGNALTALSEMTGDRAQLNEAITVHREAAGDSMDDPATASLRANLASALRTRYERTGAVDDRAEAVRLFRSVVCSATASTPLRLVAARSRGMLEADGNNWAAADSALGLAVELLNKVSEPHLARSDQERQLMGEPGLVAEAVAAALENGNVERAAVLFEQGRGILTSHALDLRTDIGHLAAAAPALADRFVRLRDALDSESNDPDRRHLWAHEWQDVLDAIRARPDFTHFLLPMSAEQIRAAATDGPIVMVNVSSRRSDALVIRPEKITAVPLPFGRHTMAANAFTFAASLEALLDTASLAENQAAELNRNIRTAIRWTWDALVQPVLSELELDGMTRWVNRSRLWWMPSTLLNFLPLHAACGEDESGRQVSALDLIVSSYTPTVRSLIKSRTRRVAIKSGAGPLAVAMKETPGQSDLPAALTEAQLIQRTFARTVCLINEHATRDDVLSRLATHSWVHFSCHGHSDRTNPSASFLLLAGATELSVLDIVRERLDGEFAFLSACSTGASGLALADESVHLAGAFQLAGYRHVVAAMWPIADSIALKVATHVYTHISPDGESLADSATVLHDAVRKIRADYPNQPMLWASFVHIGP
jgi:hypothetical protein